MLKKVSSFLPLVRWVSLIFGLNQHIIVFFPSWVFSDFPVLHKPPELFAKTKIKAELRSKMDPK